MAKLVEGYEKQVAEEFGRTIGTLETAWRKGRGESNLGNFLADQMRLAAKADVGLVNSGGIRKSMNPGSITALDINEMLPFSNMLVTARLTGKQLATVVQANADAQVGGKHGILQVSGLSYRFAAGAHEGVAAVQEILVGGKPLVAENVYTVAMPDYVVMMAHVYLNIDAPQTKDVGLTMTEAVVAGIAGAGPINSKIEGRIMRLDQK
jgi:2',3'-cyclic-nucleotide 2'-phosphodiesterase (5'-nucleotidase family)